MVELSWVELSRREENLPWKWISQPASTRKKGMKLNEIKTCRVPTRLSNRAYVWLVDWFRDPLGTIAWYVNFVEQSVQHWRCTSAANHHTTCFIDIPKMRFIREIIHFGHSYRGSTFVFYGPSHQSIRPYKRRIALSMIVSALLPCSSNSADYSKKMVIGISRLL